MFFDFFKYEPTKSSTLKTAVMKKINLVTFAHLTIFYPKVKLERSSSRKMFK